MNKRKVLGILSLVLVIFSIIFAITPKNGKALGDVIFNSLGLKVWSNGTSGLNNVVIFGLILLFISYIGVKIFLKEFYPNLVNRLPIILLAIFLLYPIAYQQGNKLIKSNFTDLRAIRYYNENSELTYEYTGNNKVKIYVTLDLENFSVEDIKFYSKILTTNTHLEDLLENEEIIVTDITSNTPLELTLPSKNRIKFQLPFEVLVKDNSSRGSGFSSNLNIIIYNDEDEMVFSGMR